MDHRHINDVLGDINPTAENMAKWIADELGPKCFKVEVQESEGTQLFMNVIEIFASIDGEGSRQGFLTTFSASMIAIFAVLIAIRLIVMALIVFSQR